MMSVGTFGRVLIRVLNLDGTVAIEEVWEAETS